jgi:hypothetical protein
MKCPNLQQDGHMSRFEGIRCRLRAAGFVVGVCLATALVAGPLAAQTVITDEGTFRLLINGRDVGTETFRIRQSGTGADAVLIASGRITLGGAIGAQEIASEIRISGVQLRPASYDITVEGAEAQRIAGRLVGGRITARIRSDAGEAGREYLVSEGAVVLDEAVAHHYFFLAPRVTGATQQVPVVLPRQSRQVMATVVLTGTESIQIGGQAVSARRVTVRPENEVERIVWFDAEGRVLRLEIPTRNYVAVRAAPPAS